VVKKTQGVQPYIHRLESLLDASKHLNTTFDLEQLLGVILNLALRNLNATSGTIYLIDESRNELWSKVLKGTDHVEIRLPIGTGISGTVAQTGETINLKEANKDSRFFSGFDKQSGFQTKTMLCMPMRNRKGKTIGVFQILNKKRGTFDRDDELFLNAFSEHAALAITSAQLHQTLLEHERVEKEMQIAGEIQQWLLPREIVPIPGYAVAAVAQPCTSVGGDFYDVIGLGENKVAFLIADVTGKGVAAALLVSTLHASVRAYIQPDTDLAKLTGKLNTLVYENSPPERFITFVILVLDLNTHILTYVNAGHNFPFLVHSPSNEVVELTSSGLPLGMLDAVDYKSEQVTLNPSDLLALYTDGVTEAMNTQKQQYDDARFKKQLLVSQDKSATEVKDAVLRDVRSFIGDEPPSDDLTLLILKRL